MRRAEIFAAPRTLSENSESSPRGPYRSTECLCHADDVVVIVQQVAKQHLDREKARRDVRAALDVECHPDPASRLAQQPAAHCLRKK